MEYVKALESTSGARHKGSYMAPQIQTSATLEGESEDEDDEKGAAHTQIEGVLTKARRDFPKIGLMQEQKGGAGK